MSRSLASFAANTYSQYGEDGIIAKIYEHIGEGSRLAVEFGAWDGYHMSNTARLWSQHGWSAVLIEREKDRADALARNTAKYAPRVVALRRTVSPDPDSKDALEKVLDASGVEKNRVDLLSIDIDSDDADCFEALGNQCMRDWRPRVVVVEYNPTLPNDYDVRQPVGAYCGCSAGALVAIAARIGYAIAAVTTTNCIFVDAPLLPALKDYETRFERIQNRDDLKYVCTGYDGRTFVVSKHAPWSYGLRHEPLHGVRTSGCVATPMILQHPPPPQMTQMCADAILARDMFVLRADAWNDAAKAAYSHIAREFPERVWALSPDSACERHVGSDLQALEKVCGTWAHQVWVISASARCAGKWALALAEAAAGASLAGRPAVAADFLAACVQPYGSENKGWFNWRQPTTGDAPVLSRRWKCFCPVFRMSARMLRALPSAGWSGYEEIFLPSMCATTSGYTLGNMSGCAISDVYRHDNPEPAARFASRPANENRLVHPVSA